MAFRRFGSAFSGLLLTLVLNGCPPPGSGNWNVLLVTLDTTRADALSCQGGRPGVTPTLERFAAEGVRFARAQSVAPLTVPSHASMLTGLYPPRHTLRANGLAALPSSARTLAESCRDGGLETAAFVSALVLDRSFGLDQGFDTYDQPPRPTVKDSSVYPQRRGKKTVAAFEQWLSRRPSDRRFFAWVHLFDPHAPYVPEPEFLAQAGGDPYLGEVAATDANVARILGLLSQHGLAENTLVLIVGDHGESLGEHGERTHSAYCYRSTNDVPFLVRFPDRRHRGDVRDDVVSVADVCPTALAALGLQVPPEIDGRDVFAGTPDPERGVYCESFTGFFEYGWSPLAGWIGASAKYLASSEPEFYDLAVDPREERNLTGSRPEFERAARAHLGEVFARPTLAASAKQDGAGLTDALRSLGYADAAPMRDDVPSPLEPSDRPSPKSRASELEALLFANALVDDHQNERALPLLEEILRANPRNTTALDSCALVLVQLGRHAEAEARLREHVALGHLPCGPRINLATCAEQRGDVLGAIRWFESALELEPNDPRVLTELAGLYERIGKSERADELRALAANTGSAPTLGAR
jgi:arylsulfatase A-like enzyme